MNVAETFGENLRKARKRTDLSQEALAVRASLHRTEIGLVERGERGVGLATAIKLAGALGVPLGELVGGIVWTPGSTERGMFLDPSRKEQYSEAMKRAAELRKAQGKETDAAELVREARKGLENRTKRRKKSRR
jgi:transcriptional regulator with XRE-family HTH domain